LFHFTFVRVWQAQIEDTEALMSPLLPLPSRTLLEHNPRRAALLALAVARQTQEQAAAYMVAGEAFLKLNQPRRALPCLERARMAAIASNDPNTQARALLWASGAHETLGQYREALDCYRLATVWREGSSTRQQARQNVEEAEQARASNRAKNDFLNHMSHELRTPLAVMLGYTELLLFETDNKTREALETILHSGKHLRDLLNDIIDIARAEDERLDLQPQIVNASSLAQEVLDSLSVQAKHVNVHLQLDIEHPASVWTDPKRLRQVLLNLVSNAIKYNKNGGIVVLRLSSQGKKMLFSVTDSGIGIGEHMMERLFRPFDRLGMEASKIEGTGIGLVLTKGLIEAMGGQLSVQSKLGSGSSFEFQLPHTEPSIDNNHVSISASQLAHASAAHLRLMYIEDNPINVKLFESMLKRDSSNSVTIALNGQDGLDLIAQEPPDALFLDLNLPDMHGSDILRQLRSDPSTAKLPVVVLTADASRETYEQITAIGVLDFMTKPYSVSDLMNKLAKVRTVLST
jgi:signal transduction histidine kinase/ActR/RegA family two-component response regulator